MKKFDFKKILPHFIAIVVFILVTVTYFAPIFFEGKDLQQGDVTSYMGWGNDVREHYKETGEYSYWSNSMFGGMPSNYAFPAPTNSIFSSLRNIFTGFMPYNTAGVFFAYLLGFYIFMIAMGCKPVLSIFGALAYALCSYNIIIIDAGHVSKALVMATIAPIIGGIILCYRKKYISGIIITLIATGMNVFWNHQQISFYLILTIICLAIIYLIFAIKNGTVIDYLKSSSVLLVVALLAASPAIDKLLPTIDFSKETMRGGTVLQTDPHGKKESKGLEIDYAYQWSYGKAETMTLLIPNLYGGCSNYTVDKDSEYFNANVKHLLSNYRISKKDAENYSNYAPMYWGDQPFTSGPVYAGAIICFLFLLGLIICKGPERWWMLAATIIAIIMSWGKNFLPFNEWLFNYLPLYNKFRTPSMSLVIVNFTMAAMSVLAIKKIIETEDKKIFLKPLYISVGVVGGICLFFTLFGKYIFDFTSVSQPGLDKQLGESVFSALIEDRKSMLVKDSLRSLIYIVLAFCAIWLYITKQFKNVYLVVAVGSLCFIDLWSVDKRFVNNESFVKLNKNRGFSASNIDKYIWQDMKDNHDNDLDYRVLNLASNTFNESQTSYFHKSIGGYSPVKLRRYQDIIDFHISSKITPAVLDMFNTKYIIFNTNQGPRVQRNASALGNAWYVDHIEWQNTPDDEIKSLYTFNPSTTALIHKEWKDKIKDESLINGIDSTAQILLKEYKNPGNIIYESNSNKNQIAVFSEVYYKTWKAYIDGKEVPILRANYILRALEVPSGKHTIEFKCVDELYETTHICSLVASILVCIIILSLLGFYIYKRVRNN